MRPGFTWGVHCEFIVQAYHQAFLSVPALSEDAPLFEKDLLAQSEGETEGKYTIAEHLTLINSEDLKHEAPLLILGVRNNLVNLRAPILWKNRAHAVEGEQPQLSRRPYYGLGSRGGKLFLGQALGGTDEIWPDFFIAGVPVLWDDAGPETLLDLILIEAADHSHVFNLPRGSHPGATEATRRVWSQLHAAFRCTVHADSPSAISAMRVALAAVDPPPVRCENYLNAVLGTRHDGALICIYAHGRLELLGERARALGCRRAVCLENSGSVMPTYMPDGIGGEQIPLLRAPNFRSQGRAALVIELSSHCFDSAVVLAAAPIAYGID